MAKNLLKTLGVVVTGVFLAQFTSCSGGSNSNNINNEIVENADKTFDGLIYGPNVIPEGKAFKKAKAEDYEMKSIQGEFHLIAECYGVKDNLKEWYTGYIKDGNLMVDPESKRYNIMWTDKYTSEFIFPAIYNAKGDTLRGIINANTGKEVLECKYQDVFYNKENGRIYYTTFDGHKGSVYTDGSPTGALIDPQGKTVPYSGGEYEVYQKGDYFGVKVNGKDKYPADKHKFLSLEKVPGMQWHFVCRSKMENGEIKCGIVSFAFDIPAIVVRRIYDDYEFLGNDGSYASNAVRFYDATHTKTSSPLVLNCNGEETGRRMTDDMMNDLAKDWQRRHYGDKWVD